MNTIYQISIKTAIGGKWERAATEPRRRDGFYTFNTMVGDMQKQNRVGEVNLVASIMSTNGKKITSKLCRRYKQVV